VSKKKKIIISIVAFFLIAGGISTTTVFLINRHYTIQSAIQSAIQYENYINTSLQNIDEWYYQFNSTTDQERKVELFHGLNDSHLGYISRDSGYSNEVADKYQTISGAMMGHFFDYFYTKIAKVEETEVTEMLIDIISEFDNRIIKLNAIKEEISDGGVFNNDVTRLNQLTEKAESLLNYYTVSSEWLTGIAEQNEKFLTANRDAKFVIFTDIIKLQENFDNNGLTYALISTKLIETATEKRLWFYDWYTDNIALLRLSITPDDISEGEDEGDEDTLSTERQQKLESIVNTLIQLNDLALLFALECETLFAPIGVRALNRSFDETMSNNLTVLEDFGIEVINSYNFHSDATEIAVEHFRTAFADWKENRSDNEHLLTFEDVLHKTIEVGEFEHIASMLAETSRRTRLGFT